MAAPPKSSIIGMVLIGVAALTWSTTGLFTRVVTTDVPTTLFWRSLFGGLGVLAVYALANRPSRLSDLVRFNKGEIVIALISGVAMCMFISAFFYTSIANVIFVYGASPLVTVMLAWLLLKDMPPAVTFAAAVLAGAGVAVLAWGGQDFSDTVGLLLAGGMTVLMASVPVLVKFYPPTDPGKTVYLSVGVAALLMAPFVADFTLDTHNLLWLAAFGVITTGLGFGLYLMGVARVTPATAALIGLLEIPLAPIWATWLFGEVVTPAIAAGGAMILVAAWMHIRTDISRV